MTDTVVIGCDHGGFALKETLKDYLLELGFHVLDLGCYDTNPVDYPDIAVLVAESVAHNGYRGIMIDGAGIGSTMVANKVPGVRCALCWDISSVINSRDHNNANMLAFGGQMIGAGLAKNMVRTWLETPYSGGRHERRVTKIMEIESRYIKMYRL